MTTDHKTELYTPKFLKNADGTYQHKEPDPELMDPFGVVDVGSIQHRKYQY